MRFLWRSALGLPYPFSIGLLDPFNRSIPHIATKTARRRVLEVVQRVSMRVSVRSVCNCDSAGKRVSFSISCSMLRFLSSIGSSFFKDSQAVEAGRRSGTFGAKISLTTAAGFDRRLFLTFWPTGIAVAHLKRLNCMELGLARRGAHSGHWN